MTHYADTTCPTCGAEPGKRCEALTSFGGTHAARVTQAQKETP